MKKVHKKIRHFPIFVYLSYFFISTLMLTGISFSRYISTTKGEDGADVAAGIVVAVPETKGNLTLQLEENQSTIAYDFTVSNEKNGTMSEVAIQYDIIVALNEPLPDGISLQLDGESPERQQEKKEYVFSQAGVFDAAKGEKHNHTLIFQAKKEDVLKEQETMERTVTVTVHAQQID